jgi:hypothetical protein
MCNLSFIDSVCNSKYIEAKYKNIMVFSLKYPLISVISSLALLILGGTFFAVGYVGLGIPFSLLGGVSFAILASKYDTIRRCLVFDLTHADDEVRLRRLTIDLACKAHNIVGPLLSRIDGIENWLGNIVD